MAAVSVDTKKSRFLKCERRSYLIGGGGQFNDIGRNPLFEVELKPEDSHVLELDGGLLFKRVDNRKLQPGLSWADEVKHFEGLIAAGMRTAYAPSRINTAFARNVAFPVDYMRDGSGKLIGVVVPRAPHHMFREARSDGDRRPQGIHHLIADARKARVDERELVPVVRRLAGAVHHFHSLGFSHGDLSGNNILCSVSPYPSVFIVDCDGASDLVGNFGEEGTTPNWRDPRIDSRLIARPDRASDDYLVSLVALRIVLLNEIADAEAFQSQRDSIQASVPPRVFQLLSGAFDDPESTVDRPTAFEWLRCTDELSKQHVGFASSDAKRQNPVEIADLATAVAAGLQVPTRVDPRVGPKSPNEKPTQEAKVAPSPRRPIRAWRESAAARSKVRAAARADRRRARPTYALALAVMLVGLASAADPGEFSFAAVRVATAELPTFAGAWIAMVVLTGLGFRMLRFSEAIFGDDRPAGYFSNFAISLVAWVAVLGAPSTMLYNSVRGSDTGLYLVPSSMVCALLFVPVLMFGIALVRFVVALSSEAPRVNAKRLLRLLELGTAIAVSVFAVTFASSWERAQQEFVYDNAKANTSDRAGCRITDADLPAHFRAWRKWDRFCRSGALQGRTTALANGAVTRAMASSRARAVESRSSSKGTKCRTGGGAWVGEIANGQLLCYSQGERSVIEWSNTAENAYYRLSGRIDRRELYALWRAARDRN